MLIIAIPVGLLIGLSLGALGGGGSILTAQPLFTCSTSNPMQLLLGHCSSSGSPRSREWRCTAGPAGSALHKGSLSARLAWPAPTLAHTCPQASNQTCC